jgi:hypothetical protein
MTQPTTPSVGRVVHYVSAGSADGVYPSTCRAADVTEILNPKTDVMDATEMRVGLMVKNPEGIHFRPLAGGGAVYDPKNAPGTWHWPERV